MVPGVFGVFGLALVLWDCALRFLAEAAGPASFSSDAFAAGGGPGRACRNPARREERWLEGLATRETVWAGVAQGSEEIGPAGVSGAGGSEEIWPWEREARSERSA